jgi:DNA repair protein RAD5
MGLYFPFGDINIAYPALPGFVEFRGSTMIDCPAVLHSGADLIVSLSIYIRASAFRNPNTSVSDDSSKTILNEGQETSDEQYLRERKNALLRLFHAVGLNPRRGRHQDILNEESINKAHPPGQIRKQATIKTEIVGDGEEIEVEDGEELTENEINVIYKRLRRVEFSDTVP